MNCRSVHAVSGCLAAVAIFACLPSIASAQQSPLEFSKSFDPVEIAPGSISTLEFRIESSSSTFVTDLAFTDNLPAGMTIAEPAGATTTCGLNAMISAPVGGSFISFSDGELPSTSEVVSCEVSVNVTAGGVGTYSNTSSPLTSSVGSANSAEDDLEVIASVPTFSKSFSPDDIVIGKRSTLTFTIEHPAGVGNAFSGTFTDPLPAGLQVASPPNLVTDCTGIVNAEAGATSVALFSGFFMADSICTISIDIVADETPGARDNLTTTLTSSAGSSGRAGDVLNVRFEPALKSFIDDPTPPGQVATLEFSIRNIDRLDTLTDIQFTDDLDATLSGLTAVGTPLNDVCGVGSQISGTSQITLTDGTIPPGGQCVFSVDVLVPAGATPGTYSNTTSSITGTRGGTPVTFNPASDDLSVFSAPVLEKAFLDDPAIAGDTTRLEFTVTNTSSTSSATDIAFTDPFDVIFPTASAVPGNDCCGAGSSCTFTPLSNPPPPSSSTPAQFSLSGGTLAPGASCTFELTLDVSDTAASGVYPNITSAVAATVDGDSVIGNQATDEVEVIGGPALTKEFIDDPVAPGSTVTLQFTLTHDQNANGDATGITFTDDLDATLAGLTATGLPLNDVCGTGSTLSGAAGDTFLTLTGGNRAPGESCQFNVTLQVPAAATSGIYANTTSDLDSTVSGEAVTTPGATDNLTVSGLTLTKEFTDDPVIPGGSTTLEFTLENVAGAPPASSISFQDLLSSVASGLTFDPGSVPAAPCGGSSAIILFSGNTGMLLSGGNLAGGTNCQFSLTVNVGASVISNTYSNTTNSFTAMIDGSMLSLPNASDDLIVESQLLLISKMFTGDPVQPGDSLTLEIGLTNQSATETVGSIAISDDLDAALSGMTVSNVQSNDCGFTVGGVGTGLLDLTAGTLPPQTTCAIVVETQIPPAAPAGTYTNTTSDASGDVGGLSVSGSAASDNFRVAGVTFSKSFDGPAAASGMVLLTFNLSNTDSGNGFAGLAFTDDLDAVLPGLTAVGLPQNDVCGTGSTLSGSGFLTLTGGQLTPAGTSGDSCAISVTVAVPPGTAPGAYLNTTSELTSSGLPVNDPATAILGIEPPPTFAKTFMPNTIAVNGTSTLTFQIDNAASALAATDLDFTDNLPAGMVVSATPNAMSTCAGGTLTAAAGSGSISLSGSTVSAGASCSVSVDVSSSTEGSFVNTSGDLTSSSGNSGSASDTLTVVSDAFMLTKSFRTNPVLPGGLVEMELSIVNGSAFPLTDIALTDDLGAVIPGLAAEGLPLSDVCGAGSQVSGTGVVSLTGGNVSPGGSCTVVVPVRVPTNAPVGTLTNTTGTATGMREGIAVEAPADSADVEVAPAQFGKSIDPDVAGAGSNVTITFALTNPDPANAIENLQFTDDLDAFISGMTAIGTPINDVCGTGSVLSGGSTLSLTGGTLSAGESCNFQVQASVPDTTSAGSYTNTTSDIGGDIDGNAIVIDAASADLEIESAPLFTKAFSPSAVGADAVSTLTLTIDNAAATIAADDLAFVDVFPGAMVVATPANTSSTCGGTLTASPGVDQIQLSGGSTGAGGTCQVQVDVTTSQLGTSTNTTGDLTSTLGNSGTASADLNVEGAPMFAKAFTPESIGPGEPVTLVFTIDNSANSAPADALAFIDPLPTGMTVSSSPDLSNTCGGTVSATAGSNMISLTDGSVAGGAMCEIRVDVNNAVAGVRTNVTEELTSSLGNSGSAVGSVTQFISVPTLDRYWMALLLLLLVAGAWIRVRTV